MDESNPWTSLIHRDLSLNSLKCPKSRRAQEVTAAISGFSYINISKGSVATQLKCGGYLTRYCRFSTECDNVEILKIGQYLAKIRFSTSRSTTNACKVCRPYDVLTTPVQLHDRCSSPTFILHLYTCSTNHLCRFRFLTNIFMYTFHCSYRHR